MPKARALLKEPLVHFLLIGTLVFAAHTVWQARQTTAERTIIISQDALQRLSTIWAGEAGREPTPDDVRGLLAEYVREEVLYREALRLGLDDDDTIIRRRLAQKMGFLLSNDADEQLLTEADLRAAYDANPEAYRQPPRISLVHVPFNFSPDGSSRASEITAIADLLESEDAPRADTLGDPFMLARRHIDIDETSLARLFGREFAQAVFELPEGQWSQPLRSRLADHLVRIDRKSAGGIPPFEDVSQTVLNDETERRKRARDGAALAELLDRYDVIIDGEPS
jgi:hypothetical protein